MPVGLQKGASGLSFTVVCIPKGMHRCPRVRDNHTAASSLRSLFAVMKTYLLCAYLEANLILRMFKDRKPYASLTN